MFRLHLFGKLAATLKLATVVKEAADMTLPYPTPVQATGRRFQLDEAKVEKLFTQHVQAIREQLKQDFTGAIPQGFLLHLIEKNPGLIEGSKLPELAKKLKKYLEQSLPNYLLGADWGKPNGALLRPGSDKNVDERIETEVANLNAHLSGDVSPTRVKQFTFEFDVQEKEWKEKNKDIADRVRNDVKKIVSLYIQKNPTKANEILQETGNWSPEDTKELASDLADNAVSNIKPLAFGKLFINSLMNSVKAKLGDASYFTSRDAVEQVPQDIMDSLFNDIIGDVQKESRRAVGIKKLDAHRWSSPSLPKFDLDGTYSLTTNMTKTVFNRVHNLSVEKLNARMRTTDEPVEKSELSKKVVDVNFAMKELNRAHKKVYDQIAFGKDLDKLIMLLKKLSASSPTGMEAKRARKAAPAILAVLVPARSQFAKEDMLAASSKTLDDLEEKFHASDSKTRSHFDLPLDKAEKIIKEIDESGDFNIDKVREAVINTFKNGENAKAIAHVYYGLKDGKGKSTTHVVFNSDFFIHEIPKMIKRTVKMESGKPELLPEKRKTIEQTFSRPSKGEPEWKDETKKEKKKVEFDPNYEVPKQEVPRYKKWLADHGHSVPPESPQKRNASSEAEPRLRVGSLWIQKLYRDYLKVQ